MADISYVKTAAHSVACTLNPLLSILPNPARNNTEINLKLCFPSLSDQEINALTRKSLIETSRNLLESGKSWITLPKTGVDSLVQAEGMKRDSESLIHVCSDDLIRS